MRENAAKFLRQPDLYVGHIARQANTLISEKLQRFHNVGGHDVKISGASPKC